MGITIQHGTDWSGVGQSLMAGLDAVQRQKQLEEERRARRFQESMQSDAAKRAESESQRAQEQWSASKDEIERQKRAREQGGRAIDAGFETRARATDLRVPLAGPLAGAGSVTFPDVPVGLPRELWDSYKRVHAQLKGMDDPDAKRLLVEQWDKMARDQANMRTLDEFGQRVGADQMHGVFQSDPNGEPDSREQELINRQSQITTTLAQLKQRAQGGESVDWKQLSDLQKQYGDLQTMVMDVRKERADRDFVQAQIMQRMAGFSGSMRMNQRANDLIERLRMRHVDPGAALKELDDITNEPEMWGDGTQSFAEADIKTRGMILREASKEALRYLHNLDDYKNGSLDERRKMEEEATDFYLRNLAKSYGWRTDVAPAGDGAPGADGGAGMGAVTRGNYGPVELYQQVFDQFVSEQGRQPSAEEFEALMQQAAGGAGTGGPAAQQGEQAVQVERPQRMVSRAQPEVATDPMIFDPVERASQRIGVKSGQREAFFRKLVVMAEDVADYQNDPQHTAASNSPFNLFGTTRPRKLTTGHDDQSQEAFSQLSAAVEDFEAKFGPLSDEERAKLEGLKWAKR